ncbi:matrix metalloproteinase-2 isoform X2 [Drosophila busckii]|nr:matrix metalloproteinase-2 isoform X2 [Drosophila busckii]
MPEADKIRIMVARALNVWESNSKLTFREVYSSQADIQVLFARRDHGDSYKFDGPGQVLAHAFYPGTGRGGDAHFDADEQWEFESSTDDSRGTNFLNVAVHELGHSLGLGHSSDSNAIMFPWYQNNEVEGKLPDDDRLGIQELYGAKSKTWGVYRPQTTPSTTSTTTTTTTTMRSYYPQVRPKNPNRHPYYPNYYPNKDRSRDRDRYTTTTTTTTSTTRAPATRRTAATRSPHKPYYYPGYPTYGQRHNKPIKPIKRKPKPDKCLTNYDAISMIRGELFIFRGQFLWRIGTKGLYNDEATETRSYWSVLPEDFGKVDAVYENKQHQIVFFIGRQYYVFDSVSLAPGYPQPLTSLGLPPSLTHIDAAFVWGYNNRTYLTSGTLYWRIDEFTGKVELDYPRDMSIWAGVGYNIDAAFQWENGKTYFFKNLGYWEFNDARMKVAHARPKLSARHWMKCPRNANDVDEEQRWTSPLVSGSNETTAGNAAAGSTKQIYRLTLCLVLLFTSLA